MRHRPHVTMTWEARCIKRYGGGGLNLVSVGPCEAELLRKAVKRVYVSTQVCADGWVMRAQYRECGLDLEIGFSYWILL